MTELQQAKNALESLYNHENELMNYFVVKEYLDQQTTKENKRIAALLRAEKD